jgi:hypothetical protein
MNQVQRLRIASVLNRDCYGRLTDALWDDYTRSWEQSLPDAVDRFSEALASAKANKDAANPDELWVRYGQWTRVNSDRGERIAHRHSFYIEKMSEFLRPLQPKAARRAFSFHPMINA